MPTNEPDSIRITIERRGEIEADRARLSVSVQGSSLVTGHAALHKAREVKELIDGLLAFGLKIEDVQLSGVNANTSNGVWTKTSTVHYTLLITMRDLERLADVIGIITSQKNTALHGVSWEYPATGPWRDEWLDDCLQQANARAQRVAVGLGVRLLGVHRFSENWKDFQEPRVAGLTSVGMARQQSSLDHDTVTQEEMGLSGAHTQPLELSVTVQYLISQFTDSQTDDSAPLGFE